MDRLMIGLIFVVGMVFISITWVVVEGMGILEHEDMPQGFQSI